MIFYFSGTGNSLYVAQKIGNKLGEAVVDMAQEMKEKAGSLQYTLEEGEKLGFVFPVYAWGLPVAVEAFLGRMILENEKHPYTFGVCTCGGTAGETIEKLKKCLASKGIHLNSGFSVVMPDNYVVCFEVEDKTREQEKLNHADMVLKKIIKAIAIERVNFFKVKKGTCSKIKSSLVHFLFNLFFRNTKRFYVTGECIGCELCADVCTKGCIHMEKDRPVWEKGNCYMCLACLNRCPKRAIQYGKTTEKRGRYINPSI